MMNGVVIGIVTDNADPDKMHRVKVEYPVDADEAPASDWCRMITPMAGADRGLVILPEIGTEVLIGFAYRSMQPYILGAVYNGADDKPEPYANEDGDNNIRIFWSRNDHQVVFDDTDGAELVGLGATASSAADVTSGVIYQVLDDANKTLTEYCDGDTTWEATANVEIKCTDLKIEASGSVTLEAGSTLDAKGSASGTVEGSSSLEGSAGSVTIG